MTEPAAPTRTGLDVLVEGLFDYAGMFPPASLSFAAALEKAARFHRVLKRPWLVGSDFVAACGELAGIRAGALEGYSGTEFRVCALGAPLAQLGPNASETAARSAELAALLLFNETGARRSPRVKIVSYEIKVSDGISLDAASEAVRRMRDQLGGGGIRVYLEPEWKAPERGSGVGDFFKFLDALNRRNGDRIGLKVRGAGPTSVGMEALCRIIPEIAERSLPLKATAGLHHPIIEPGRYGNALGFLNLVAALRLRRGLGKAFGPEALRRCLANEDPGTFRFEDGVSWREYSIDAGRLREAARAVPFCIGSCSIEEPDADLIRLFP